eukprot:TRINITY_DN14853_c0_g1_i1.p1 TRINITY_DN14853_c0_g1~~TRINITY_DN14853_c0_g1_i1.p1  ORF type:complete len:172 (+),score=34.16 TRINITY_DN14853_c0_g1_i1:60-518(+)
MCIRDRYQRRVHGDMSSNLFAFKCQQEKILNRYQQMFREFERTIEITHEVPGSPFKPYLTSPLKLMAYNLANFDSWPRWDDRKYKIAELIDANGADFVALEEARQKRFPKWKDMVQDLVSLLKTSYYVVFQAAMDYNDENPFGVIDLSLIHI